VAFRDDTHIDLQSKSQKPLTRYFPEVVAALNTLSPRTFVLDGEIVIPIDAHLSFDDLLMRIHPAASRIQKLSEATLAVFIVFDLLVDEKGQNLVKLSLQERRKRLESFAREHFEDAGLLRLSPTTEDIRIARRRFHMGAGLDGIVAKNKDLSYQSGERTGMRKIKVQRSADCVLGGFRYLAKKKLVGSLLLGLYNSEGNSIMWVSLPRFTTNNAQRSPRNWKS
jgi:ATP-dependent DNA ligase